MTPAPRRDGKASSSDQQAIEFTEVSGETTVLKLPNMNEFSPGVLGPGIQRILRVLAPQAGNRRALLDTLEEMGTIAKTTTNDDQRKTRAGNVLIGMSECDLFDLKSNQFTPLAQSIIDAPSAAEGARLFGSHILKNLHGHALVDVVRVARERGAAKISLDTIRRALRSLGFVVTTNEGNASKLRLWLQESGVVDENWNFDESLLTEMGGLGSATLKEFASLTPQQIVLLNEIRAQAILRPSGEWIELSPIIDLIALEHTKDFLPEGRLRAKVIDPLSDVWIEARGTGKNQGGNAGEVRPLPKLMSLAEEIPLPSEVGIPADLRPLLSTPLAKLFEDLESYNTHEKGIALELLALNILIGIGLTPVGFRLRASEAADVETDLTANGIHLQYSRWLVQCKNTLELKHDQVARELGLAMVLRSHVILMITTGKVSARARQLAAQAARQTYVQVLFIDEPILERYRAKGASEIVAQLRKQAGHVLELKKFQDPLASGS